MEKFRGFRGLTGDRETFPVKDFPTGIFKKMVADIIQEKGGLQSQYSCMNVGFNSYGLPLITFQSRVSSAMTRATLHVAWFRVTQSSSYANRRRQVTFI